MPIKLIEGDAAEIILDVTGPCDVLASSFAAPGNLELVDQDFHIATIVDKVNLKMTLTVKTGRGYEPADLREDEDRAVGALLSNEISKIHGEKGLPKNTLNITFNGSAGQSFGAFTTKGVSMVVSGTCNDYFGKGLSGGKLVVKVPDRNTLIAHQNIIIIYAWSCCHRRSNRGYFS